MQGGAIGEHDSVETSGRAARLGGVNENRDYVPRLYGSLGPANQDKRRRTARFADPMSHVAFIILDIEIKEAVRIRPHKFRHGRLLQFDKLVCISSVSVMCQRSATES